MKYEMRKQNKNELFCAFDEEKNKYPATLDIIKIDGHWAQMLTSGYHTQALIKYLDSAETETINFDDYILIKNIGCAVGTMEIMEEKRIFTDKEIKNIHCGRMKKAYFKLKREVHVFAEYKKR